jgi:Flp pilus assembly CpaF family ATPase
VFTLQDYVAGGIMTEDRASALRNAVGERKNILVAGGTSSGKTRLTNALLGEVAKTSDRIVIEDTRELRWKAQKALRTLTPLQDAAQEITQSLPA